MAKTTKRKTETIVRVKYSGGICTTYCTNADLQTTLDHVLIDFDNPTDIWEVKLNKIAIVKDGKILRKKVKYTYE